MAQLDTTGEIVFTIQLEMTAPQKSYKGTVSIGSKNTPIEINFTTPIPPKGQWKWSDLFRKPGPFDSIRATWDITHPAIKDVRAGAVIKMTDSAGRNRDVSPATRKFVLDRILAQTAVDRKIIVVSNTWRFFPEDWASWFTAIQELADAGQ